MKIKNLVILVILFITTLLILPMNIFADDIAIISYNSDFEEEDIDEVNNKNSAKTLEYDSENNSLTLNNYNGGSIIYMLEDDLTINLIGENIITSDYSIDGIASYASSLTFNGEGTLLIQNVYSGICSYYGNVIINNLSITIDNVVDSGLYSFGGKTIINGKVSIDADKDKVLEDAGYFMGYTGVSATGDIEINNDLEIKNARSGINSNGNVIFKSGISNIESDGTVIHAAKKFSVLGGKVNIKLNENEEITYGVDAGEVNISNGYLHVLVPSGKATLVSFGDEEDPSIIIDEKMIVEPNDYKIIDKELIPDNIANTIGSSNNEIFNEVTISAKETVTFNTSGGSSIDSTSVSYGSKIESPENPTKENCIFDGWYEDDKFEKEFNFDTLIINNITLYAKWNQKYNITVKSNDESMGSVSVEKNMAIKGEHILLTYESNNGYHFVKWESNDIDASFGEFDMPESDVIVTAIFEKNTYKVSFDKNGGTGEMNDITNLNGSYTLPKNEFLAPDGKIFKGWSLSENGEIITEINVNEDKIVYAIWQDEYEYKFVDGDNQQLIIDEINGYTFTIDGDYSLFESIKIANLDLIKDEDYTVREGSTIITFTSNGIKKLNTLSKGNYDVKVTYSNGKEVTGKIAIYTSELNPKTGDNILIYISIAIISIIGIIIGILKLRKMKRI